MSVDYKLKALSVLHYVEIREPVELQDTIKGYQTTDLENSRISTLNSKFKVNLT